MTNLTLQEAVEKLKQVPTNQNEMKDFMEFADLADKTGAEILSRKGDEYILDMFSVIHSLACSILIDQGGDVIDVLRLTSKNTVEEYAALVMKLSVGLAAMEELR